MLRSVALCLAICVSPAVAQDRVTAEEIYELHQAGERLLPWQVNRLTTECRVVPGTTRALTLGGRSLIKRMGDGPVLVFIDGDVGGKRRADGAGFALSNDAYAALKALGRDGSPDPAWLGASRRGCGSTLLEYGYFGIPVIYGARSGTYGTPGHYARDIYRQSETDAIKTLLDELSAIGVKQFVVFGFSGGAQAAAMAIAGRDDVVLFVPVGGMLSAQHHRFGYPHNDPLPLAGQMPPTLIVHSSNDKRASFEGARAFETAMRAAGRDVEFITVQSSHFDSTIEAKIILKERLMKMGY